MHKLNGNPNLDYLGHPINAYHFIRHVASGWKRILSDGPQIDNWISNNVGSIVWNDLFGDIGKPKALLWCQINKFNLKYMSLSNSA